jgi:antitoxin MazE
MTIANTPLPQTRRQVPPLVRRGPFVLDMQYYNCYNTAKGTLNMLKTSIRRVGNSLGITLPKTIVESYHLNEGDEIHLIETDDGLFLTPFNPTFAEWAKAYEKTNKRYRNTLRALAK